MGNFRDMKPGKPVVIQGQSKTERSVWQKLKSLFTTFNWPKDHDPNGLYFVETTSEIDAATKSYIDETQSVIEAARQLPQNRKRRRIVKNTDGGER